MFTKRGFTLLEVLIVVGVLAIIAGISTPIFRSFVKRNELDSTFTNIIFDLKRARSNSMSGESGLYWGVHFNSVTGSYYYQIFSSPATFASVSTTIESTIFLPKQVIFSSPASSSTRDVIFEKISGSVLSTTTITIQNTVDSMQKSININSVGNVY